MIVLPYNRRAAVEYAHKWAFGRNPEFYDFSEIGGDCTNFASQCLYAGSGVMNFTPDLGWYYIDPNNRAPAWTGVPFFWDFMTRKNRTVGPWGINSTINLIRPGDFVQIRFRESGPIFAHTPVVVSVGYPPNLSNILIAAHSNDSDNRPLSTYENVDEFRFLHIIGSFAEEAPVETPPRPMPLRSQAPTGQFSAPEGAALPEEAEAAPSDME